MCLAQTKLPMVQKYPALVLSSSRFMEPERGKRFRGSWFGVAEMAKSEGSFDTRDVHQDFSSKPQLR